MLDASVVFSKGSSGRSVVLSAATPHVILDGGAAGGSLVIAPGPGAAETATVDNSFTPGSWGAASNPQAVAAGTRRAFRQADPTVQVPVSWTFA